jgi:Uma2 family endonuclease
VVEVLSTSTRKKDTSIKLALYQRAGVREYWIVDPKQRRIYVYGFEKGELPVIYTFENKVPVGIFDGAIEVDFTEIYAEILETGLF